MMRIIHGKAPKPSGGTIKVTFPTPFNQVPNVVISQHWDKQHQQVGSGETIDEITTTGFTVISGNSAANYYIEWIAISDE